MDFVGESAGGGARLGGNLGLCRHQLTTAATSAWSKATSEMAPVSVLFAESLEAFAPLFAVATQRVEDDGVGLASRADLIHLDGFTFEQFVILKKTAQHQHAMGRHFRRLAVRIKLR